jgi:sec-independent protein translocase protein TatA
MGFAGHLPELIVLLVAALVIFGPKRLPEIGSAMGKGIREFRKSTTEEEDSSGDHQVATDKTGQIDSPPTVDTAPVPPPTVEAAQAPPTVEAAQAPNSADAHDVGAAAASTPKPDVL